MPRAYSAERPHRLARFGPWFWRPPSSARLRPVRWASLVDRRGTPGRTRARPPAPLPLKACCPVDWAARETLAHLTFIRLRPTQRIGCPLVGLALSFPSGPTFLPCRCHDASNTLLPVALARSQIFYSTNCFACLMAGSVDRAQTNQGHGSQGSNLFYQEKKRAQDLTKRTIE